jgi:hypothetical protein
MYSEINASSRAINGESLSDGKDTDIEEASWILDREHLCRAMELSAASSSSWRPHPHVHGVESLLRGRFWAVDSESESESDVSVIDQLSCFMYNRQQDCPDTCHNRIPKTQHPLHCMTKMLRAGVWFGRRPLAQAH